MQNLYLMRGPQGSGKSTFLKDNGLELWTLSKDSLRLIFGSVEMSTSGTMGANHSNEDHIHNLFIKLLGERMSKGHTTFVDVTHFNSNFSEYKALVDRWAYQCKVIEFGVGVSAEDLILRIKGRVKSAPHHNVSDQSIVRSLSALANRKTPSWIESITPDQAIAEINNFAQDMTHTYKGILFIGDIQGSATPLKRLLDEVDTDDKLIVFTGDLFDRGIENDDVLIITKSLLEQGKARLICGNHERHILTWRHGESTPGEFWRGTIPQLRRVGFDYDMADFLVSKMENMLHIKHGDKMIQVTHGGAPAVIEQPNLFPGYQCWKGVGHYSDDIDSMFEALADKNWYQVHGHRNMVNRDLCGSQRSFNLEGSVEFGGNLRALIFDGESFNPIEIKNKVFLPMSQRNIKYTRFVPQWTLAQNSLALSAEQAIAECLIDQHELDELRQHELVRESVQVIMPHISSFNFTREAFYSQSYDSCNMRARGLYINTESREIVIRGYDKYFNVNERGIESAQLEKILSVSKPPFRMSIKENGYLGLVGYDSYADELVYASKSTTSGDHAIWLKEQMEKHLNKTELNRLRCILRDCQMSLAFEVIEPVNDPHIIEYQEPSIVLLDGIRRSMKFEKINHEDLAVLGKMFSFDTKKQGPLLPDNLALTGFLSTVTQKGFVHQGQEIEGLVAEDSQGNMFKIKLPYYNLWKFARSAAQAVNRLNEKGSPIKPHFTKEPLIEFFIEWLKEQDPELAKQDIISIRKAFLADYPEYEHAVSVQFQIRQESA